MRICLYLQYHIPSINMYPLKKILQPTSRLHNSAFKNVSRPQRSTCSNSTGRNTQIPSQPQSSCKVIVAGNHYRTFKATLIHNFTGIVQILQCIRGAIFQKDMAFIHAQLTQKDIHCPGLRHGFICPLPTTDNNPSSNALLKSFCCRSAAHFQTGTRLSIRMDPCTEHDQTIRLLTDKAPVRTKTDPRKHNHRRQHHQQYRSRNAQPNHRFFAFSRHKIKVGLPGSFPALPKSSVNRPGCNKTASVSRSPAYPPVWRGYRRAPGPCFPTG